MRAILFVVGARKDRILTENKDKEKRIMKAGIITLVIIILLGGGIFALTKIKADADASAAKTRN